MALSPHKNIEIRPESLTRLKSFGYGINADSYTYLPTTLTDFQEIFDLSRSSGRKIVLRGNGRSYGDASVASEKIAISLANHNAILDWNLDEGTVKVQAGCSLYDLCRFCVPLGYWPPVVSGTSGTSIAGAIAMDIHGKNNFKQGFFCDHVTEIGFITANGEFQTIVSSDPQFQAIRGSLGLYGIVTEATIKLRKIEAPFINRKQYYCDSWEKQFSLFQSNIENVDAAVSWVDGFSNEAALLEVANYVPKIDQFDLPSGPDHSTISASQGYRILKLMFNDHVLKFAHESKLFYSKLIGPRPQRIDLYTFNFQLDRLIDWDRAYLPGCLIQYQSAIPKSEAISVFKKQVEACNQAGFVPRLLVCKRHRPGSAILDYSLDGYSLAIDLYCPPDKKNEIEALYRELARLTIEAKGKVYLAKDFLLTKEEFESMHSSEKLVEFKQWKNKFDPDQVFYSLLGERLGLISS